jgi:sugar diacid utilization regulator
MYMGDNEIYVRVCGTVQIPVSKSLTSLAQLHHKLNERSENKDSILQCVKDLHSSRNTLIYRVIRINEKSTKNYI